MLSPAMHALASFNSHLRPESLLSRIAFFPMGILAFARTGDNLRLDNISQRRIGKTKVPVRLGVREVAQRHPTVHETRIRD